MMRSEQAIQYKGKIRRCPNAANIGSSLSVETEQTPDGGGVSDNSFLDPLGPNMRQPRPRHSAVHLSPGQGLCIHVVQSARSHCIAAGTRAAPGEALLGVWSGYV